MTRQTPVTIVNAGYRSTNYWVVSAGRQRLLVDLGWPGRMGAMEAELRRLDIPLGEIKYGLATHYHLDHAGHAQELKLAGIPLLVMESQLEAIPLMKRHAKPQDHFRDITLHDNIVITFAESRQILREIGVDGEVVPTPGHSPDSVSLVLDDGSAFTGDLTLPSMIGLEDRETVFESWRRLRDLGAKTIYAGHGRPGPMPVL